MEQFKKRLKSFIWRTSIATGLFLTAYITTNIEELGLSQIGVLLLTFIVAEITKWLNSKEVDLPN